MRPYWKGYLKLALVSCPIALHAACSTAERITFRQINKATGHRLRQQLIDEETCEPVAPEHKGRGYEVAKGQYLVVEDAEVEAIEIESTHIIEIDSFVPRSGIDQRFFDTPYYVTPNEPVGQEAFAVIREAMRGKGMVALGRLVLSKRERVIALQPYEKGLLGTTLRYPYEVRKAEEYFCDLPELTIAPDMLTLAKPLAGGLPMGAVLVSEEIGATIKPGDHGTTFGGGPLVASVANYVFDRLSDPSLLKAVRENGAWLGEQLDGIARRSGKVRAIRGTGFIWGLDVVESANDIVKRGWEEGLLVLTAGEHTLRLLPPLVMDRTDLGRGISILEKIISQ